MDSPYLTHLCAGINILTNSRQPFCAEKVNARREPSAIKGSSKFGGGDFVVIMPDEGSVSSFHLECPPEVSSMFVGVLPSLLELDKEMTSSSTKSSSSFIDDCSV